MSHSKSFSFVRAQQQVRSLSKLTKKKVEKEKKKRKKEEEEKLFSKLKIICFNN